jgi:glycosyltransferase involved in cell wall biosynthesis
MIRSRKTRIAVLGLKGLPAFGGAAAVGENIIEQLKDIYDFTVYSTSSHTNLKTASNNGYKQIVFRKIPFKKLNTLFYYILSGYHAVIFGKYDLIHLHHNDGAFLLPLLKLRYRIIVTTHGVHNSGLISKWIKYKWFFQGQIKYFLKYANRIICVSKKEVNWLKERHNIQAKYIPNGINIINNLKQINIKSDIFFGAGRIIKSKGCDILLKALHKIEFSGKIFIAGDLDQSNKDKKEILALSKGLNVEFLGLIKDKNELLSYISNSRLFVFPSLQEAMSMMLLEAASVKTPIVCSDLIENKDVFSSSDVLFFKSDDYLDLAKSIQYAFSNYGILQNKTLNAFNKLKRDYNWKNIAKEYSKIYNGISS